jgi:hypothetical protein
VIGPLLAFSAGSGWHIAPFGGTSKKGTAAGLLAQATSNSVKDAWRDIWKAARRLDQSPRRTPNLRISRAGVMFRRYRTGCRLVLLAKAESALPSECWATALKVPESTCRNLLRARRGELAVEGVRQRAPPFIMPHTDADRA